MAVTLESMELGLRNHRLVDVNGTLYAYVVESGAIFDLDELTRAVVLRLRDGGLPAAALASEVAQQTRSSPQEVSEAVEELRNLGLVSFATDGPAPALPKAPADFPLKTLVLHVSHRCNLGCSYCYAGGGNYGGPENLMDLETAQRAVDFLLEASGDHTEVDLVFFGGEPLLNLPILKKVAVYAAHAGARAGKRVRFALTTNGTVLDDEALAFIAEHQVGVTVSLDGPRDVHDQLRFYKGGRGSYDVILPKVRRLLADYRGRPVAARVTLAKPGVGRVVETFDHLREIGFGEVGFSPVMTGHPSYALSDADLELMVEEFGELAGRFVEAAGRNEYLGFSNLSSMLMELFEGSPKPYPCGAGLGLLSSNPEGQLYTCHRLNQVSGFEMGDIFAGIDPEKRVRVVEDYHVSRKLPCQSCWVKHICAGGCYYESHVRHGDASRANEHICTWMRAWVETGVRSYIQIMEENPGFLFTLSGEWQNPLPGDPFLNS